MIYGVGVCPAGRQICFCLGSMSLLCGLSVLGGSVDIGACTELPSNESYSLSTPNCQVWFCYPFFIVHFNL